VNAKRVRRGAAEPKCVAVLGSTGSIGRQALDVIARHPERFEVVGLAAGRNVELLAEQIARFRPRAVSTADADTATELMVRLDAAGLRIHGKMFGKTRDVETIGHGAKGLYEVACETGADVVLAATDGAVAFDAVFAAVDRGIDVALANKELIVAAGELLVAHAARSGAKLLPVDSEHSAIFQCLQGAPADRIAAIVLTASGGPFWTRTRAEMESATVADALAHPTWRMGVKNTIDSATLMNKGLEVIEASHLFGVPGERIHVLVHRTSVAHGFVAFTDGNVVGQLAPPDMRLPIGYALAYPDRLADRPFADAIEALGGERGAPATTLAFERPDPDRFPCLRLAYEALAQGGTAPAVVSAANEVAVAAFVEGAIRFGEIPVCIETALERVGRGTLSLDGVREADRSARDVARAFVVDRTARPSRST
jgi:1-deoxy-D-xylulose-5-phosphate reductoisomerase